MPTLVSNIYNNLLRVHLQCISTYSATIFVRDIHFVLLRNKPEEMEENITKESGGEPERLSPPTHGASFRGHVIKKQQPYRM
jgi:hypothetical protein